MAAVDEIGITSRRPAPPDGLIDPARYTSPEFAALETERLWTRTWQLACLDSDIPNAGDHYEYTIGPYSVVVLRDDGGQVRAFHNVCLHRGRRIRTGCGSAPALRCPYHGWTWGLDGELQTVPEREAFCPFDDADYALRPVRVEQWNHWIFINIEPDGESLAEYLGDVAGILAPYRFERQYKWWSRSTVVRANWKNALDAFNEAYHARMVHPESVPFTNYTDYEIRLIGRHSLMVIPFGEADAYARPDIPDLQEALDAMEWSFNAFGEDTAMISLLRGLTLEPGQQLREPLTPMLRMGMEAMQMDPTGLADGQLTEDWHIFIFPNIVLNVFAFGYFLFRIRPVHGDPGATSFDMWYHHRVPDGSELPEPDPDQFIAEGESCGAVMDQDFRNIPVQQLGQQSPVFPGLKLSSLESRISHMHAVLDQYLADSQR